MASPAPQRARGRAQPPVSSLYDACIAHAESVRRDRLKELKDMQAKLALLEAFIPALKERGCELHPSRLHWCRSEKAIRLESPLFDSGNRRLYGALVELRFVEIDRRDHGTWAVLKMKHGRLVVNLSVATKHLPPAADATTEAPADGHQDKEA